MTLPCCAPLRALFVSLLVVMVSASWGCSGCDSTTSNNMSSQDMTGDEDMTQDSDPTTGDMGEEDLSQVMCTPGEIVACREENTPAIDQCNDEGNAISAAACPNGSVCRQAECVQVACIPGSRRCQSSGIDDPGRPQQCDEAGDTFVDQSPCAQGNRCEDGFCLDRCDIARQRKSYIGCEYWAVELENHLLYDEGVTPDRQPPFAVVLANTSTTYDAEITVFGDDEVVADLVAERLVGSDVMTPDVVPTTVYSEVVSPDG